MWPDDYWKRCWKHVGIHMCSKYSRFSPWHVNLSWFAYILYITSWGMTAARRSPGNYSLRSIRSFAWSTFLSIVSCSFCPCNKELKLVFSFSTLQSHMSISFISRRQVANRVPSAVRSVGIDAHFIGAVEWLFVNSAENATRSSNTPRLA